MGLGGQHPLWAPHSSVACPAARARRGDPEEELGAGESGGSEALGRRVGARASEEGSSTTGLRGVARAWMPLWGGLRLAEGPALRPSQQRQVLEMSQGLGAGLASLPAVGVHGVPQVTG